MSGGQRPFGTFPKIHLFWRHYPSLMELLYVFVLFEEGRICRPLWCTFSGRGVPKMTNRRSVILIEFGKSVNQVDVCAQNRLGALLSSRFHSLHLSQQFKDDPILKLEVLIKALSLLILCVVSWVNYLAIFSSMPLSLSQKIKLLISAVHGPLAE